MPPQISFLQIFDNERDSPRLLYIVLETVQPQARVKGERLGHGHHQHLYILTPISPEDKVDELRNQLKKKEALNKLI